MLGSPPLYKSSALGYNCESLSPPEKPIIPEGSFRGGEPLLQLIGWERTGIFLGAPQREWGLFPKRCPTCGKNGRRKFSPKTWGKILISAPAFRLPKAFEFPKFLAAESPFVGNPEDITFYQGI